MASSSDSGLTRDFGYLFPFLEKVRQTAPHLMSPERDRLLWLLQGEREKWEEIRALLSGAKVESAPSVRLSSELPTSLTVGPLKAPRR